jgi:predicted nucleic acid-binding protein
MIILDTNVISALMHEMPDKAVATWLDRQAPLSIWTTSITVLEIRFGIAIMAAGRRRSFLNDSFEKMIRETLDQRVAAFDIASAQEAAALMAQRQKNGQPGELRDVMIAGTTLAHRATLATRNTRHFSDLSTPVVNPWETAA